MNESVLNSIIKLFALIVLYEKEQDPLLSFGFVKLFLKRQFNEKIQAAQIENYQSCLIRYGSDSATKKDYEEILLKICSKINLGLTKKQKLVVLINLIHYLKSYILFSEDSVSEAKGILPLVSKIASIFRFSNEAFHTISHFLNNQLASIQDKNHLLIINQDKLFHHAGIKHQTIEGLQGQISLLYIPDYSSILFNYFGETQLTYNQNNVFNGLTYLFEPGNHLSTHAGVKVYYNEVIQNFMDIQQKITLTAAEIKFRFPNTDVGIEPFSFEAKSGELVGIMGISGSGKSTLLNLLNGTLPLAGGAIYINGFSIHENSHLLNGLVGYVPQDDLIIEELTVFENMYYNAKMCFGQLSKEKIIEKVHCELKGLDIFDIKDLPAGNPLNKYISGGQRKRLNIALETIRKPSILFIDEPTSGLSSSDSEKIIDLLKKLTFSGKLLFINIHQPSSNIFKKLDKLIVLDKGGLPVYYGSPVDAITYFRQNTQQLNLIEGQCPTCRTVHPDDILELIELKKNDAQGNEINERKYDPKHWYERFLDEINKPVTESPVQTDLPEINFSKPEKWEQFLTYIKRTLSIKIYDKQFIAASLLITPFLAVLLSYFVKSYPIENGLRQAYNFAENSNIPSFIFMSVVVPLFIGLSVSAQEIFKDRKILKREHFLNLSWGSYLNSKITVLFVLSAIQSFFYVLISNTILEIQGMFMSYFLVLFSLSCLSNLMGLFLSATLKSIIAIYILIPLVLIPQLLFSGVIIPFDKINYHISSEKYVPIAAELMPSRWGYEALMVNQFANNAYQKHFFDVEQQISNYSFVINYTLPRLQVLLNELTKKDINKHHKTQKTSLLYNELVKISDDFSYNLDKYLQIFGTDLPDIDALNKTELMLLRLKSLLNKTLVTAITERDSIINKFTTIESIQKNHNNYKVGEVVKNSMSFERIVLDKNSLIRKYEPIYMEPESKWGRAHFYAPIKKIASLKISTLHFNLMVIWLMSLAIYLILLFKWHDVALWSRSNRKK